MFVATNHGFFKNFSFSRSMHERNPKAQPSNLAEAKRHFLRNRSTFGIFQYLQLRGHSKRIGKGPRSLTSRIKLISESNN